MEINRSRELNRQIRETEKRLRQTRELATHITPIADGLPKGRALVSMVERTAVKALALEEELKALRAELASTQAELLVEILSVASPPQEQTVIILRYVECLSYPQIADRMNLSLRHVFHLHKKFLRNYIDRRA